MINRFRSKIGISLSLSYLTLCVIALLGLLVSEPDAMSGLALLFLTSPWSFLLLEAVPESFAAGGGMVAFSSILIVCALVNASIFYLLGMLITKIISSPKNESFD